MARKARKPKANHQARNRKPDLREREIESVDMKRDPSKENPHVSKPNDWKWYVPSPEMLANYGSFPFGFPVGTEYPKDALAHGRSTPGSMALYFTPVLGNLSDAEVAPVNIAMRKFYTFVRHDNS